MGQLERTNRRRFPWYGWCAGVALLGGEVGLAAGVYAIQVLFYCVAWWSYIILIDAVVWKRRGDSLLRNRPWEFLVLAFWSTALWNLFELFNFRLKDWFYVNVPTAFPYGVVYTLLAYATVVPGLFETYDLLRAFGVADNSRLRPWRIRPFGLARAASAGLAMLVTPILWPRYAYPLIWGFATFLVDPVCYLLGPSRTRSLLAHFERGDPRPFLRLLLAGLICGGLWEFWNYWAFTKWIYTVPFFEESKWFEMPPLGFLGFPPFAVECYVLINLLDAFRRGRGWEGPALHGPGAPRGLATGAVIFACLFNLTVYAGIDRFTVQSYAPLLSDLEGVPQEGIERLARLGVETPRALLRRSATIAQREALARATGLVLPDLERLRASAQLADLNGLGATHTNELRRLGIEQVGTLAQQNPSSLLERWRSVVERTSPTLDQVRVWVRAARRVAAGESWPPGRREVATASRSDGRGQSTDRGR